ncbi:MAG: hypothetical protein KF687_09380 [Cyclobacteriaceae bacterium]|nr:hypothetical protein [Cyclobacteriaceae bacterium]
MNKLFAIAFTCIYLLLTVGVVKTTHYCMGRAKSAEIFSFEAKKCACSRFIPKDSGCCHDEHEIIKVQDDQSVTANLTTPVPDLFVLSSIQHEELVYIIDETIFYNRYNDYFPPPEAIFRVNCCFLLYDSHDLIG